MSATIMLIPDSTYTSQRPKTKNHHLTVAYFDGELSKEDISRLNRSVERWAYQIQEPIEAKANGIGMFGAGNDGVALVDLIDGIGTFHVRNMVEVGFGVHRVGYRLDPLQIDYTHGFTPHITREYLKAEDDYYAEVCMDMVPDIKFNFIAIGVWHGKNDDQKYEVEL